MNTPNFNRVQTLEPPPYLIDLRSSGQHYTLNTEAKQLASDNNTKPQGVHEGNAESKPIVEIRVQHDGIRSPSSMKMGAG